MRIFVCQLEKLTRLLFDEAYMRLPKQRVLNLLIPVSAGQLNDVVDAIEMSQFVESCHRQWLLSGELFVPG